ncbi:hypothetical protein ACOSQ2_021891 [Xanthoceras sorbifolium]
MLVQTLLQIVKISIENHRKEVIIIIVEEMVEEEAKVEMVEDGTKLADQSAKSVRNQTILIQSTAYYATPETVCDIAWYADSGTTNHVTSDLNNLALQTEYQCSDRLVVGNGLSMFSIKLVPIILCLRILLVVAVIVQLNMLC